MTPERWQQIESIQQRALELAPEYRSAFLERACEGDESLELLPNKALKLTKHEIFVAQLASRLGHSRATKVCRSFFRVKKTDNALLINAETTTQR